MPCAKYDSLKKERKVALDNVNLFHPQNRSVHLSSDRSASKMREAAQKRAVELATEIGLHVAACDVCKREHGEDSLF